MEKNKEYGGSTLKTATTTLSLIAFSVSAFFACSFGDPKYDQAYLDSLQGGAGSYQVPKGAGGSGSAIVETCPSHCSIITIQNAKLRRGTLTPSKSVLGLRNGDMCICPEGSGGASSTSVSTTGGVLGTGGFTGETEDPPAASGGSTTIDYPSYGGYESSGGSTGETQDPPKGGSGNTEDPPGTGGMGETQDPPKGGSCGCPTGGASSTGGSLGTGGVGETQDPPKGGTSGVGGTTGVAGMTGVGGGSTEDPPAGGKSGIGGGSTQDPPKGGTSSAGGTSSKGGSTASGGTSAAGGTTGSTCCPKQEYKFYVTQAEEDLGSGTVTCTNLQTQEVITSRCDDASCCYYTIPNSCDSWACHQTNRSNGMPRIPSYDPSSQKGVLAWGASAIITTGEHYWLEEGIDYSISCDANQACELILFPHAGERFYN